MLSEVDIIKGNICRYEHINIKHSKRKNTERGDKFKRQMTDGGNVT
jgi:hypothetical protein